MPYGNLAISSIQSLNPNPDELDLGRLTKAERVVGSAGSPISAKLVRDIARKRSS
jgi:hypothetical protein